MIGYINGEEEFFYKIRQGIIRYVKRTGERPTTFDEIQVKDESNPAIEGTIDYVFSEMLKSGEIINKWHNIGDDFIDTEDKIKYCRENGIRHYVIKN